MLRLDTNDTIAAIGSPPGPAVRGIVRLSGPEAWEIGLEGLFLGGWATAEPTTGLDVSRHVAAFGLTPPRCPPRFLPLAPPRTYTGQEMAEIHSTGSPPIVQQILSDCLDRWRASLNPASLLCSLSSPAGST